MYYDFKRQNEGEGLKTQKHDDLRNHDEDIHDLIT